MKTIGIVALVAVLMAVSVLADVTVHGDVKLADGITDAGPGIEVTVQCDNGQITTIMDTTDANSEYDVGFNSSVCGVGSTVTASVPGDEESDVVENEDAVVGLQDLFLLNIELSIPEFSAIAAGVAFAGAGLGYVFMRKRR